MSDIAFPDEETATGGAAAADAAALLKPIRRIAHALDIRSRAVERATGLTIPQLILLQAVRDLGEVTTSALSGHAALTPATVVAILDKLETRGLVERYRSRADRRIVHARLTPAGSQKLDAAPPLLDAEFLARFAALPQEERRNISGALQRIAAMMMPAPSGDIRG